MRIAKQLICTISLIQLPLHVKRLRFITLRKLAHVVYLVKVDGGWGTWVEGPCSQTCEPGFRFRTRLCNQPAPANGGLPCVGFWNITDVCNLGPCPGNNI